MTSFPFRVGSSRMDLDGAPYGGSRYPVDATMADRTFVKFKMDVGIGDVVLEPVELIKTRDWFGFAEIPSVSVPTIQKEQQFAESWQANRHLWFQADYGIFYAGKFIKESQPPGRNLNYWTLWAGYKF